MKTALIILATGEYEIGARVMFHTLERYGGLPGYVDRYALGVSDCEYANPLPITGDYSKVPVNRKYFAKVADKFEALRLPHDRIILMDADMICVGDCSYLWSEAIGNLGFYACRDTASVIYYGNEIQRIGLNSSRLFNAGTMIFQMSVLGRGFYQEFLDYIAGGLQAYDGGDQGYLNAYFQLYYNGEIGVLPSEYNESFDVNMPTLPDHARRIIHFTGPNANPWRPNLSKGDPRWTYIQKWQAALETCQ